MRSKFDRAFYIPHGISLLYVRRFAADLRLIYVLNT